MGDNSKITRVAEYSCATRIGHLDYHPLTYQVSVSPVANESAAATRTRLEQAARDLAKTISGCTNVEFVKIQPTPEELAKAPKVESGIERWTRFLYQNGFQSYLDAMERCEKRFGATACNR